MKALMILLSFAGAAYLVWVLAALILLAVRDKYALASRFETAVLAGIIPIGALIYGAARGWDWLFRRPTQ